ncbi:hypothetical protein STANM309S_01442 [Streptomyces tanashiensis]
MLANQSKNTTKGMPSRYPGWRKQAAEAYLSGFTRAYESNRAPFFIGNHFEQWGTAFHEHDRYERSRASRQGAAGAKDCTARLLQEDTAVRGPTLGRRWTR